MLVGEEHIVAAVDLLVADSAVHHDSNLLVGGCVVDIAAVLGHTAVQSYSGMHQFLA